MTLLTAVWEVLASYFPVVAGCNPEGVAWLGRLVACSIEVNLTPLVKKRRNFE
jgi:hypothetical protein